jgi:hypothetical protein
LRQAYDYWQDQPGSILTQTTNGVVLNELSIALLLKCILKTSFKIELLGSRTST